VILFICCVAALALLGWLGGRYHRTDWGHPVLNRLEGINRFFCLKFHRMQADPVPLPETGGAVLVANHVSGLDPVAMIAASPRPLRWMIAQEEYDRVVLRWFFRLLGLIPVDRTGRPEKSLRSAIKALRDGEVVAVYPEGGFSNFDEPTLRLKRGAVFMADIANVPIIPLRIEGVKGVGMTIPALFFRSRLRIHAGEPIGPELSADARLAAIAAFIRPDIKALDGDAPKGS